MSASAIVNSAPPPLDSPQYHLPLHQSNFRLQGLPLVDHDPSLTLSRVSMTTEEYLRIPRHEREAMAIRRAEGRVDDGLPLRPYDTQQYAMGADRYSLHGSVAYSHRGGEGRAGQTPTLTLDRASSSSLGPLYSHQHTFATWRDRVPFSCPVRYPELMSYDPLLINSRVLGLTRDIGMRNTASLVESSSSVAGHGGVSGAAGASAFSLAMDRNETGMSLSKHSVAFRMADHRTYPGLGGDVGTSTAVGASKTLAGASAERFLDPFIAGYDEKDYENDFENTKVKASRVAAASSRAAKLKAMGISGFPPERSYSTLGTSSSIGTSRSMRASSSGAVAPTTLRGRNQRSAQTLGSAAAKSSSSSSSPSSAQQQNSRRPASAPKYADYLAQQREDADRRANASLIGAIGSTFGQLAADERQRFDTNHNKNGDGVAGNAWVTFKPASNAAAPLAGSTSFGFGHRDGDLDAKTNSAAPPQRGVHSALPTRHLSRDWDWVDPDPASSYLISRSQQRQRQRC